MLNISNFTQKDMRKNVAILVLVSTMRSLVDLHCRAKRKKHA